MKASHTVAILHEPDAIIEHDHIELAKVFWNFKGHSRGVACEITAAKNWVKGQQSCDYFMGSKLIKKLRTITDNNRCSQTGNSFNVL